LENQGDQMAFINVFFFTSFGGSTGIKKAEDGVF
jgi:hypothetical protein